MDTYFLTRSFGNTSYSFSISTSGEIVESVRGLGYGNEEVSPSKYLSIFPERDTPQDEETFGGLTSHQFMIQAKTNKPLYTIAAIKKGGQVVEQGPPVGGLVNGDPWVR